MGSEDFSTDFDKGYEILMAFRDHGRLTAHQARALMVLYKQRESSRVKLKEKVRVSNEGQFSISVIETLIRRGYIERQEKREGNKEAYYSILPEGSQLVEVVMRETGYSN